jgi:hypothetical protein
MRSGDRPGLQNRRAASFGVVDGFDSHSLPPSDSRHNLWGFRTRKLVLLVRDGLSPIQALAVRDGTMMSVIACYKIYR